MRTICHPIPYPTPTRPKSLVSPGGKGVVTANDAFREFQLGQVAICQPFSAQSTKRKLCVEGKWNGGDPFPAVGDRRLAVPLPPQTSPCTVLHHWPSVNKHSRSTEGEDVG